MPSRWHILAVLFVARTAMAFQFQSVAALAPYLRQDLGADLADIGFSIGLYLAPGLVLALPGGAIGNRFGDKRAVLFGLGLMLCGGLVAIFAGVWELHLFGRLVAGVGGVLLNVLMTKMVSDWFAGKEITTAMGVFVNSWPCGIALALVALPPIVATGGLIAAFAAVTGFIVVGVATLALFYTSPEAAATPAGAFAVESAWPKRPVFLAVIITGVIWGLYNASLGMIFSFGPSMLAERGWDAASAGSATSIALWLVVISVPLGGIIADRTGRGGTVLIGGLLAFSAMLPVAARADEVLMAFVALGLVSGLSAGPIMSLPARVLSPGNRAMGMGAFYTLFYLLVVLGPWIGGWAGEVAGNPAVTFDIGAPMLIACCGGVWLFRALARDEA